MATEDLAAYDLVSHMSPFWDAQMLFPVLRWLEEKKIYPSEDVIKVREAVLAATASNDDKKATAVQTAAGLEYYLKSYIAALIAYKKDQQNRMSGMPEKKTLAELSEWCQKLKNAKDIKEEDLPFPADVDEKLLHLTKVFYQIGDYAHSKHYFDFYLSHVCELLYEGSDSSRRTSCYWGIAAAVILNHSLHFSYSGSEDALSISNGMAAPTGEGEDILDSLKPEDAVQSILKLGEIFETTALKMSRELLMLQRSWLLHWAIWPLFRCYFPYLLSNASSSNISPCWNQLTDWVMDERNMGIVQLICPHLMRYYSAYVILNRKRKDHFQAVVKLITLTKSKYSDPFTTLLEALFVDFNFDIAQQHLLQIRTTCSADFFLDPLKGDIEEHSRLLIFEIYCRIHKSISLTMIAKKMNMTPDVAERWIVNLIRSAKLEAKIDSEKNRVEMTMPVPTIYQQIVDKTRNVYSRSAAIFQSYTHLMSGRADGDSKDLLIAASQQPRGTRGQRNTIRQNEDSGNMSTGRRGTGRSGNRGSAVNNYSSNIGNTASSKISPSVVMQRDDDGFGE